VVSHASAALLHGLPDWPLMLDQVHVTRRRRCEGRRGRADERSESVGESRSRAAIALAGLPEPVLQWEVAGFRTDFGWPDHCVVGEFDGEIKYGRLLRPGQQPGDVVFAEKRRKTPFAHTASRSSAGPGKT
jgi:hypothetical protein